MSVVVWRFEKTCFRTWVMLVILMRILLPESLNVLARAGLEAAPRRHCALREYEQARLGRTAECHAPASNRGVYCKTRWWFQLQGCASGTAKSLNFSSFFHEYISQLQDIGRLLSPRGLDSVWLCSRFSTGSQSVQSWLGPGVHISR